MRHYYYAIYVLIFLTLAGAWHDMTPTLWTVVAIITLILSLAHE